MILKETCYVWYVFHLTWSNLDIIYCKLQPSCSCWWYVITRSLHTFISFTPVTSLHQKINMKSCICISNCKDANSLQLTHTTADETWLISLCGSRHKGHLLWNTDYLSCWHAWPSYCLFLDMSLPTDCQPSVASLALLAQRYQHSIIKLTGLSSHLLWLYELTFCFYIQLACLESSRHDPPAAAWLAACRLISAPDHLYETVYAAKKHQHTTLQQILDFPKEQITRKVHIPAAEMLAIW